MTTRHVFRQLSDEWPRLGRFPAGTAALERWQQRYPTLGGFRSPAELVHACQAGTDDIRRHELAGILIELAPHDAFASRAALQALLPGLWGLASRVARHRAHPIGPRRVWDSFGDLQHDVVAIAATKLASGAAAGKPWAARRVIDTVWDTLRQTIRTELRVVEHTIGLDGLSEPPAGDSLSASLDRVAAVLVAAVQRGILDHADAAVIYTTKVLGHPDATVSAARRMQETTVRQRRARGVRRLAVAAENGQLPIAC